MCFVLALAQEHSPTSINQVYGCLAFPLSRKYHNLTLYTVGRKYCSSAPVHGRVRLVYIELVHAFYTLYQCLSI